MKDLRSVTDVLSEKSLIVDESISLIVAQLDGISAEFAKNEQKIAMLEQRIRVLEAKNNET